MEVPLLETASLILRAHRTSDLDANAAMWAEPSVVRYIFGKPSTRAGSWARMACSRGFWDLLDYGYWAIEEKATGTFVGDIGFLEARRDIVPSIEGRRKAAGCWRPLFTAAAMGSKPRAPSSPGATPICQRTVPCV